MDAARLHVVSQGHNIKLLRVAQIAQLPGNGLLQLAARRVSQGIGVGLVAIEQGGGDLLDLARHPQVSEGHFAHVVVHVGNEGLVESPGEPRAGGALAR